MRTLEFNKPFNVVSSTLNKEYLNDYTSGNYERSSAILTKYGVVVASELSWQTNTGKDVFTYFTTVINKKHYSAFLAEAKLSDRCLKWMATHFIKTIIEQELTHPPHRKATRKINPLSSSSSRYKHKQNSRG